jgi:hypothetical protein
LAVTQPRKIHIYHAHNHFMLTLNQCSSILVGATIVLMLWLIFVATKIITIHNMIVHVWVNRSEMFLLELGMNQIPFWGDTSEIMTTIYAEHKNKWKIMQKK